MPNGFVVPPSFRDDDALARACAALGGPFAVRSSAASEDGADASFAGQFRTELDVSGADAVRDFRQPPPKLSEIKRYVFNGFKRGCYWQAKFDSDTERQMAVLLERDENIPPLTSVLPEVQQITAMQLRMAANSDGLAA